MGLGDVFRALSDPTRRRILALLRERDLTAGELAERFELARSTLSGHFNVLKQAGLVVTERQGTRIVYSINTGALEEALGLVAGLLDGHRAGVGVPEIDSGSPPAPDETPPPEE